ncbi:hypothetical protein [Alkalibacter rhizosphaerae]|nr:hypothetical protein [Alkalibacter rhizosphaerae]
MIFDTVSIRNTYASYYPTSASIALYRTGSGAYGTALPMILYAGNQTGIPALSSSTNVSASRPSKVTGAYSYTISAGQGSKSVSISTALIDSLGSGASNCLFIDAGSRTANYMSFNGRNDLTKVVLTINWASRTTACSAPTSCSVNATLAEGNVTLSWSGAASGTNNTISSYEIQYSESSNNSTWGGWVALTTVTTTATSGNVSVSPPATRGYYRRFQIRTRGTAGSSYYSGWKISTNSVRKNTLPTAPTSFSVSPTTYNNQNVTLSWSGATAGTSAIKQYNIEHCTSTDGSTWSSWSTLTTVTSSTTSGSKVVTPTTVAGTYTKYRISVTDTLNAVSSYKESNSIYAAITACGAPTACSVNITLAENSVTLSWSGATSGAGNTITSYEIQYSESADGATWGAWAALSTLTTTATSGSVSVEPSSMRGYYRRFQVRTRGTAGSTYYSDWKISTNSVRKNTLPTAPSVFTAEPEIYEANSIQITWSGAIAGTSPIKQYVLQKATSMDAITWSAYEAVATILSTETFGSYETLASITAGTYTRYRINVADTLGAVSSYVLSNHVKKNSPPSVPVISAPMANSATYNTTPRFLITTGTEPDGQTQLAGVKIGTNGWQDSYNNSELFSQSGYLGNGVKTIYQAPTQAYGSLAVTFRCVDEGIFSSSTEVGRVITILADPFEAVLPNDTKVKAAHIITLRAAVNNVRNYYGLSAVIWNENIIAGETLVRNWPYHIKEIRTALEEVVDLINQFDPTSAFDLPEVDWLPLGFGRPRADVMNQLYSLVLQL